jgi:hypothetical protein
MKQLLLLGVSLIAVSACAMQQQPAPPLAATGLAAGSATNTTTAFDGYYGHAVARGLSPGCPDYVTGHELTIRDGLATFHTNTVPATGSGIPATGPLNFQGYVNPQGGLAMVSQQGQTFQGQIDSNFVLTGRASGPNCLYDATWNRMRTL